MNLNAVTNVLKAAAMVNDSVLIEGVHGIGKSDTAVQLAEMYDMHLEVLFLSQQEVGDLIGIPHVVEDGEHKLTTWSVPIWLQRMRDAHAKGKRCMLFLDEINRAPIDVRQSALQLVLEGKIHEHALPRDKDYKTFIVAAANPASDYQADELDKALLDRFLCVTAEPDLKAWLKWAERSNVERVVMDYLLENEKQLWWQPKDTSQKGPTPRAWAMVSKYVAMRDSIEPEAFYDILAGRLGTATAGTFFTFVKNYVDVVKAQDIIDFVAESKSKGENIEKTAKGIEKLMHKAEVTQKTDMAEQLQKIALESGDYHPYLAFLYSLETEIVVGHIQGFRSESMNNFLKIVKYDTQVNNKKLFDGLFEQSRSGK